MNCLPRLQKEGVSGNLRDINCCSSPPSLLLLQVLGRQRLRRRHQSVHLATSYEKKQASQKAKSCSIWCYVPTKPPTGPSTMPPTAAPIIGAAIFPDILYACRRISEHNDKGDLESTLIRFVALFRIAYLSQLLLPLLSMLISFTDVSLNFIQRCLLFSHKRADISCD